MCRQISDAFTAVLASHDLSGGRFSTLLAVSEFPGITLARLAEELAVKPATATGLVDGLVKRGLLVRGTTSSDRRVQTLTLTEDGDLVLQEVMPGIEEWLEQLVGGIGVDERNAALRLFESVQNALSSPEEE